MGPLSSGITSPADDLLRAQARTRGAAPAIHDAACAVTLDYAALCARADTLCDALALAGVGEGDTVALLADSSADHFALLFACARLGAMFVPLNWRLSGRELSAIVADCAPRVLIHDATFASAASACAPAQSGRWQLRGVHEAPTRLVEASAERVPAPQLPPGSERPVLVLYTSGTSGRPKGVMISMRQILANARTTTALCGLRDSDRCLVALPLFHTGGLNCLATPTLFSGGTVVLTPRFDATASLELMCTQQITSFIGVPTMIAALLDAGMSRDRVPRLRTLLCGGAPCPPSVLERARERGVPLRIGFGMTEVGPNCFTLSAPGGPLRPGDVGEPVSGSEARVVGPQGEVLGEGAVGELWLRGPHVMLGYLGQSGASAEALDQAGWLHTGDLATRHADGRYAIVGRKKEMFISGGENVYPAEVEAALYAHPAVAAVAVVGVHDARWGQVGLAMVQVRAPVSPDALRAWAREQLAGYKVPRHLRVVSALPTNATGKIDKLAIARAHEEDEHEA